MNMNWSNSRATWALLGVILALGALILSLTVVSGGGQSAAADAGASLPTLARLHDGTGDGIPASLSSRFDRSPVKPVPGTFHLEEAGDGQVGIFSADNGQTCVLVVAPGAGHESALSCGEETELASKGSIAALRTPGTHGDAFVAGVVPDGVDSVELSDGTTGTRSVAVVGNVYGTLVSDPGAVTWTDPSGAKKGRELPATLTK
jgi:hypothetical protein